MGGRQYKKKKKHQTNQGTLPIVDKRPATDQNQEKTENAVETMLNIVKIEKPKHDAVTVWSVTLAALVAVIYFFQLRSMQAANDLARRNSEQNSRAWVSIHESGELHFVRDEPIKAPFKILNTGSTSAKHVYVQFWIRMIPITDNPYLPENGPRFVGEVGSLLPFSENISDTVMQVSAVRQRSTTPPSSDSENWPLSNQEASDFIAGSNYILIFGRVTYDDIFGMSHFTQYCAFHANGKAAPHAASCAAYNGEDNNQEP
jgi:hypothetical protein